jgi:hypothetical protein
MFRISLDTGVPETFPLLDKEGPGGVPSLLRTITDRRTPPHFSQRRGTESASMAPFRDHHSIQRPEDGGNRTSFAGPVSPGDREWLLFTEVRAGVIDDRRIS